MNKLSQVFSRYVLSADAHGVWCTRGSYYSRKLHDMAESRFVYSKYFVLSVNVCNLSMNLIGEINA